MLLKDKIIIVSGIGPGLGCELSSRAAQEGAAGVAIAARTASKLDQAETLIRELGLDTPVLKVPADICDQKACQHIVDTCVERFGRVDALINSAYASGRFTLIEDADLDDWHKTLDTNLIGTLRLCQATIPVMKKQGGGAIVMINSMVTRKPLATQAGYAASKAALGSATASLALEIGAHNIRVNSAFMGWMWGPPVEGYLRATAESTGATVEALRAEIGKNIALGDIPDDADCAKVAIFLASDYSVAMSGACVDVNGGEYLPR